MVKIKVEGRGANLVALMISKFLRDQGLSTNCWTRVTPSEVSGCRRKAVKADDEVSIVAMTR